MAAPTLLDTENPRPIIGIDSRRDAVNPKAVYGIKSNLAVMHGVKYSPGKNAFALSPTSITPSSLLQPRLDLLVGHLLGFKVRPVQHSSGVEPPHRRGKRYIVDRQVGREREQHDFETSGPSACISLVEAKKEKVKKKRAVEGFRTHNDVEPFETARTTTSSTIFPAAPPWSLCPPHRLYREVAPIPRYIL
jgi:hypothetical protein